MPWTEHFDMCNSLGAPTVHGEWTQCCRQWPRSLNSTLLIGAVLLVLFTKHRQRPIEWACTCVWWSTNPAGIPGTEHSMRGTRRLPSLPERMCCRYLVIDIRADKEFLLLHGHLSARVRLGHILGTCSIPNFCTRLSESTTRTYTTRRLRWLQL